MYKRYIDDVIIVRNGKENALVQYLNKLNQNNKNISFSWEYAMRQMHFSGSNYISDGWKVQN